MARPSTPRAGYHDVPAEAPEPGERIRRTQLREDNTHHVTGSDLRPGDVIAEGVVLDVWPDGSDGHVVETLIGQVRIPPGQHAMLLAALAPGVLGSLIRGAVESGVLTTEH